MTRRILLAEAAKKGQETEEFRGAENGSMGL